MNCDRCRRNREYLLGKEYLEGTKDISIVKFLCVLCLEQVEKYAPKTV